MPCAAGVEGFLADEVHAITGVVNTGSIAFHGRMGFEVSDPIEGHHGPGTTLVHFRRPVSPAT